MSDILRTEHVSKIYRNNGDDFYALNDVSVNIEEGRLCILCGRSGSGKTTLLNILSTLDTPSKGTVFFGKKEINSLNENEKGKFRSRKTGFVFQSVALIPIMNAYENVEFSLRLAGITKDRDERIKQVLKLVGMQERMKHMPLQMSGGEQQRVAIARAIAHRPKVLFADEPTAALDTQNGLKVIELFKALNEEEGITVVMTTHDRNLMERADILYELSDGVLQ